METIIEAHGTYTIIRVDANDGRSYRIAGQCWSFRRLRNARRRAKALARMAAKS